MDTSPDLTFTKNAACARWHNTQEDLRSDYSVIEIQVDLGPYHHCRHRENGAKGKHHRLVDWDVFREARKEQNRSSVAIEDIESWTAMLKQDVEVATRKVPLEADFQVTDRRLLHVWEAKRSLQERWKRQRRITARYSDA